MEKSDLLHFETCGHFFTNNRWIHSCRYIENYEIIFVTKGTVYIFEENVQFTLSAKDYLVLHPGLYHGGFQHSEGPTEFYWLHFVNPPSEFLPSLAFPCNGQFKNNSNFFQIIRQLLHISSSPAYSKETLDHLAYVLLSEFKVQKQQTEPQNALAAQAYEYVRSHSYMPLTAHSVADSLNYHPDYLSRILKSCYGFTLKQAIISERIKQIQFLLYTTNLTITKISSELGFSDPNAFEKFFHYHTGYTPTTYRNSFYKQYTNHK